MIQAREHFDSILRLGNFTAAEKEFRKALQINPNCPDVHHLYSCFLCFLEHTDEAIKESQPAIELDPLSNLFISNLGAAYYHGHQGDKAIELLKKVVKITGRDPLPLSSLAGYYYLNGDHAKAEKLINEVEEKSKSLYIPPTMIYSYYIIKNDWDTAFYWLEKAFMEHDSYLLWFDVCPTKFHQIPDETRFNALKLKYWKEIRELKINYSNSVINRNNSIKIKLFYC